VTVTEQTIVMPVDYLSAGCNWAWMEDLNVLLIRDTLGDDEREALVTELVAEWWRSHLRVVKAG
jgi:hypothetical protein